MPGSKSDLLGEVMSKEIAFLLRTILALSLLSNRINEVVESKTVIYSIKNSPTMHNRIFIPAKQSVSSC